MLNKMGARYSRDECISQVDPWEKEHCTQVNDSTDRMCSVWRAEPLLLRESDSELMTRYIH